MVGPNVFLEGAGVSLGGRPILRAVDLTVSPGEVVGVTGPNGSGKTTLLRLLATLIEPDRGTGMILEARLGSTEVYDIRRRIGLVSHIPAVIDELTLRENLEHAARLSGHGSDKIDTALRVVGLDDAAERRGEAGSFGMLRRTEVARLLITGPRLLLLDEALSGLDVDALDLIDALVERTVEGGGSVVMVSHDARNLTERTVKVLKLAAGRLEAVA